MADINYDRWISGELSRLDRGEQDALDKLRKAEQARDAMANSKPGQYNDDDYYKAGVALDTARKEYNSYKKSRAAREKELRNRASTQNAAATMLGAVTTDMPYSYGNIQQDINSYLKGSDTALLNTLARVIKRKRDAELGLRQVLAYVRDGVQGAGTPAGIGVAKQSLEQALTEYERVLGEVVRQVPDQSKRAYLFSRAKDMAAGTEKAPDVSHSNGQNIVQQVGDKYGR